MTTYVSQGSAATYLRGGESFNSNFLHRSLMHFTVEKYENWSTFVEVIARQTWPGTFDTRCKGHANIRGFKVSVLRCLSM